MGNCQAADIGAIIVEYPNGRVEKVFLATLAHQLMAQNPGYFVVLVSSPSSSSSSLASPPFLSASSSSSSSSSSFASSSSVHPSSSLRAASATATASAEKSELPDSDGCTSDRRFFKLLASDAPLRVGHRYRLVSFEEVFTYFAQGGCDINLGGNSSMPRAMQTRRPNYVSKYHHDQYHHHTNNTGKLARLHTVKTVKTGC